MSFFQVGPGNAFPDRFEVVMRKVKQLPLRTKGRLGWLARAVLVAWAVLTFTGQANSAETPAQGKLSPAPTKKIDLHHLTNEALVKNAAAIYDKASWDFLAQRRGLAFAEMLLQELQDKITRAKASPPGTANPKVGQRTAADAAKKVLDRARAKKDFFRRQLQRIQAQRGLQDRVSTALEASRSATVAFQNTLDDLKAYAVESGLRVKDGSLAEKMVPKVLKPAFLEKKRSELTHEMGRLKTKVADVQQGQKTVARLQEQTSKAALGADAEVVEAANNLVREQRRQQLEKAYTGKKQDDLVTELAGMLDEGIGLKGTFELALRKFDTRAQEAARLRQELDALRRPRAKVPQLTRAEDLDTAAKAIRELINFYAARTKKIEDLGTALAALTREGEEFEADAAVSEEHLFKIQVLADLLKKSGLPDAKLPEKARAKTLGPAAGRLKQSAAAVRAATAKAKSEVVRLDRQRHEAQAAGQAAAKQLANLKESQEVTVAALKWEGRLKGLTSPQAVQTFTTTRKQLTQRLRKLQPEAEQYHKAALLAAEAKARLDGLKDPFLRAAEEQGQAEKQKLLAGLRKEAGLERGGGAAAPAVPAGTTKKAAAVHPSKPDARSELEKAADPLLTFQQLLAGRLRVLEEREARKADLLAALDQVNQRATAYGKTVAGARLLALELNATAVDLKKRLGKGDLSADQMPEGITEALRLENRAKLDGAATSILNALNQVQQDRTKLRRKGPDEKAVAAATNDLLTVVGRRLDLLADLKRLAEDYRQEKSARPPSETKRLQQRAAERQSNDSSAWDTLLGIDSSKSAKDLEGLLESFYQELIEIEDKEENLKKQREKVNELAELTRKEMAALARVLPRLARQLTRLAAAREEDTVLARARLRPERAEELLQAYQAKTGRLLAKPLPVPEKVKAKQVEELGNMLFEWHIRQEAAKKWADVLGARAAAGIKAEAGVYQDELTRINAASAANARHVQTLTGRDNPGPPTGGEIGKTRQELDRVRTNGVQRIGLAIGGILLAAFLLPRVLVWALWRLIGGSRGERSSLVFSALRAVLKIGAWVAAIILILKILGFNVTAILAGLGIFGLAIGLAAQPLFADVIGAVVIFAERRFKPGDVIRLGTDDPARVVGLTWRSTQVQNADGLLVTIPNRKVTEATIQNQTRAGRAYDSVTVSVSTQQEAARVLAVLERAMAECEHLAADRTVAVKEFNQKGDTKTIKYRFSWFLMDYATRNNTRDEVFARIGASLAHEDMIGTEISLA
jgi:small-conductance mechanosensitive channel